MQHMPMPALTTSAVLSFVLGTPLLGMGREWVAQANTKRASTTVASRYAS
jgi:hypothetical protein